MKTDLVVKVYLWDMFIGLLAWDSDKGNSIFQFSEEYLDSDIDIAPIAYNKNRMKGRPFYGNKGDKYQGLPSFIADSLPDAWGNTLFDEWLTRNNIPASQATPLMKLSFIGKRGMGALEFVPDSDLSNDAVKVDIGQLYEMSQRILRERWTVNMNKSDEITLEKLILLGTSAGGKHPKGIIALNPKTGDIRSGQVGLPEGYKYYIIKFKEDPSIPTCEIEMVYHLMAKDAGISMMDCNLYPVNGINHFITERFDRKDGKKVFSQTLAAISPSSNDYLHLFWAAESLGLKPEEKEDIFRRMVFNYVAGVSDDHNKNFSFLYEKDKGWSLAPAYDVMFTANIWDDITANVHALGVSGKNAHVMVADMVELGEDFGIENPQEIIREICFSVSRFGRRCKDLNIDEKWTERIESVIKSCFPIEYRYMFDIDTLSLGSFPDDEKTSLLLSGRIEGTYVNKEGTTCIATLDRKRQDVLLIDINDLPKEISVPEGLDKKMENEIRVGHTVFNKKDQTYYGYDIYSARIVPCKNPENEKKRALFEKEKSETFKSVSPGRFVRKPRNKPE